MTSPDNNHIELMAGNIDHLQASYNSTNTLSVFPLHVHDSSYEMMLFQSGDINYYIGDQAYRLLPGDVSLICPNVFHGVQINSNQTYKRYPVHFSQKLVEGLNTSRTDLTSCFHSSETHICHLTDSEQKDYIHYTHQIIQGITDKGFGWDIQVCSSLSMLLLLVNAASHNSYGERIGILPPLVQDTIRFIDAHLTEELSIQLIADSMGISRSRLMHLFKQHTNLSLWSYVTNKRIILAKDLLQQGHSITDACYESGFQDYSHFIKVFNKANKGLTPGQFAKSHAAEFKVLENSKGQSNSLSPDDQAE